MYRWDGGSALVQTVDFFTPIVDDPYAYGQIAAANALSDIYAMGGQPLTALAIAGFPKEGLDRETMRAIFVGGFSMLREAGVALLGGHTVQDAEIKFGYAVTGSVDPARVFSNAGAKPGDELLLTKSLGTGIVGTAIKFRRAPERLMDEAVRSMLTLNRAAADFLRRLPSGQVRACTDITGFGLIGHASQMAAASGVTIELASASVPLFDGVLPLVQKNRSGGLTTNREFFSAHVRISGAVEPDLVSLLYDPQTSGGLLAAVSADAAADVAAGLSAAGVAVARIGRVVPPSDVRLVVSQ